MRWRAGTFAQLKPEKVFAWTAGLFGLLFLFLTPPLQVPDEPAHFLRAWRISEGNFFADREDNRVGGWVPLSLEKFSHPYWLAIFPGTPVTVDTLIHSSKIVINPQVKKFKDFNNTALYSPVCYAPQALGIFICRLFGGNPFYCFYAGRLLALLTWFFCVYAAIKWMPFQKWLMVFLALLPMSLYENMSLSADVMTNAVSFLFISMVLRYAADDLPVSGRRFTSLVAISLLLVSMKSIYGSLLLLLFTISPRKYGGLKMFLSKTVAVILLSGIVMFVWTILLAPALITYEQYNPVFRDDLSIVPGADAGKQMAYIIHHGFYFFKVFFYSVVSAFPMYSRGFVGVFGWLSVPLPDSIIAITWIILFIAAFADSSLVAFPSLKTRLILFTTFLLLVLLVFLSQHLIWDPVGGDIISNIQGRYLIPCIPLFFVALGTCKVRTKMTNPLVVIYLVGLLSYSCYLVYCKYLGAD